jgi:hypothetical protein
VRSGGAVCNRDTVTDELLDGVLLDRWKAISPVAEALCLIRWRPGMPALGRREENQVEVRDSCRMATVGLSGPAVLTERGPDSARGEGGVSALYVESSTDYKSSTQCQLSKMTNAATRRLPGRATTRCLGRRSRR